MNRWWRRLGGLLALCAGLLALGPAGTAAAHPLGNFTVNHYDGLRLFADRVELHAVVDYAEIPTLQQRPLLDTDADGTISAAETRPPGRRGVRRGGRRRGGDGRRGRAVLDRAGRRAGPAAGRGRAEHHPRRVPARARPAALAEPATVEITDGYLADRIGWREITAAGDGRAAGRVAVPAATVSDGAARLPRRPAHRPAGRALGDAAGRAGHRRRRARPRRCRPCPRSTACSAS